MGKKKILIVDDEINCLRMFHIILEQEGYKIAEATNGIEAIEKTQKENFDLILLDLKMPDMDGYEVCRALKVGKKTSSVPIIILTGSTKVTEMDKSFSSGANAYMDKSTSPVKVIAKVKEMIEKSKEE